MPRTLTTWCQLCETYYPEQHKNHPHVHIHEVSYAKPFHSDDLEYCECGALRFIGATIWYSPETNAR